MATQWDGVNSLKLLLPTHLCVEWNEDFSRSNVGLLSLSLLSPISYVTSIASRMDRIPQPVNDWRWREDRKAIGEKASQTNYVKNQRLSLQFQLKMRNKTYLKKQ